MINSDIPVFLWGWKEEVIESYSVKKHVNFIKIIKKAIKWELLILIVPPFFCSYSSKKTSYV